MLSSKICLICLLICPSICPRYFLFLPYFFPCKFYKCCHLLFMLHTKSIYENKTPEDGIRILVMRKWPRGVRKEKITYWKKELGPSTQLLDDWNNHKISWEQYEKRFKNEMQNSEQQKAIKEITSLLKKQNVTLLCWEKSDHHCHRRLLKELIETTR